MVAVAAVAVSFWNKGISMPVHVAILVNAARVLLVTVNALCLLMTGLLPPSPAVITWPSILANARVAIAFRDEKNPFLHSCPSLILTGVQ